MDSTKPLNSITNIINNFNYNNPNSPNLKNNSSTNLNNLNNNRPSLIKKPISISENNSSSRISYPLSSPYNIQKEPLLTNSVINLDSNNNNNSKLKSNNNSNINNNNNSINRNVSLSSSQNSRASLLNKKNTPSSSTTTTYSSSTVKKKFEDFKPPQTNISTNLRKTIASSSSNHHSSLSARNIINNTTTTNTPIINKVSTITNKINQNNQQQSQQQQQINKMISSTSSPISDSLNISALTSTTTTTALSSDQFKKSNFLSSGAPFTSDKTYSSLQERIGKIDEFTQSFRGNLQTQFESINDTFTKPRLSLSVHDLKTRLDYEEKNKENDKLKTEIKNLVILIQDKEKELLEQKYKSTQLLVQNESLQNGLDNANRIINTLQQELDNNSMKQSEIDKQFSLIQLNQSEKDLEIEKLNRIINEREQSINQLLKENERLSEKSRQDEKIRRQLHNIIQELKGNIRVFCRIRPDINSNGINDYQQQQQQLYILPPGTDNCIDVNTTVTNAFNGESSLKKINYQFDRVFGPKSTQNIVFEEISQLVQSSLDGYNTCIFSYGQTGSGKTHTLFGPSSSSDSNNGNGGFNQFDEERGMIPRAVELIFDTIKGDLKNQGWKYQLECFFLEIYNESIVDLLNNNKSMVDSLKYEIKHNPDTNQTSVTNLTVVPVSSPSKVYDLLNMAQKNRSVAKTLMNERSSRSHTVFQLKLIGYNEKTGERTQGLLNLIDLAGSERVSKSGVTGDRLKETQAINKSLSSLSDVISALANKEQHIPYRNSKLTYLLQNSIGGNSKTLMFVNISPESKDLQESISSLRFASKVNSCELGQAKKHTKYDSK